MIKYTTAVLTRTAATEAILPRRFTRNASHPAYAVTLEAGRAQNAYGKGGEIASNRRDGQEMFVLCLRILQPALVHVDPLTLRDILDDRAAPMSRVARRRHTAAPGVLETCAWRGPPAWEVPRPEATVRVARPLPFRGPPTALRPARG